MITQSPISPGQLDSATPVMIDEQIQFEVHHLIASLDLTQSAFARAIGYGDGTVSKWKSGQQRLRAPGNRSLQASDGGAVVPPVVGAGALDQATDREQRGSQVEVEVDDVPVAVGAAA